MNTPKIFFTRLPSGYCPVQAEGFIDGYPFYFRSRWERMRFKVAASGRAAGWENVAWSYAEQYRDGEPCAAGGASMEECFEFINRAAARWVSDKGGEICARWKESGGGGAGLQRVEIYEESPNAKSSHKGDKENNILKSDVQMCMFWYKDEATFIHFTEVCTDPDGFEYNYKEWLENVEKAMAGLRKIGCDIQKIHVEPDEFLLWCKAGNRSPNGDARSQYASEKGRIDSAFNN